MSIKFVLSALFSVALMVGCADMQTTNAPAAPITTVDAQEIAALNSGEVLELDLRVNQVYSIDFSQPFDMSRVVLVSLGQEFTLEEWLVQSNELGIDYLAAVDKQFSVTGSPENFGTLSYKQISDLETNFVLDVSLPDRGEQSALKQPVDEPDSVTYWCAILAYGCHKY